MTWCGDGVIDSPDGESCDPADASKTGWGTAGCSASCQPVNTPSSNIPSLKLKKYAKSIATGDSQTVPVSIARGETFNYYYTLENDGAATASAKDVVVKDTLPDSLTFAGNIVVRNASGIDVTSDWICTKGTYNSTPRITLICTKKTDMPANSGLYTFTIPVTLSLTAPIGISMQNIAYVCASNATNNPK